MLLIDLALSPKWMFQMQAGFTDKRSVEDTMAVGPDGLPDRITPSHALRNVRSFQRRHVPKTVRLAGKPKKTKTTTISASRSTDVPCIHRWDHGGRTTKFGASLAYMSYRHNVGIAGGRNYVDTVPGTPCDPADPNTHASCSQVTEYPGLTACGRWVGGGWFLRRRQKRLTSAFCPGSLHHQALPDAGSGLCFDVGVLGATTKETSWGSLVGYGPRLSLVYDPLHDRSTLISAPLRTPQRRRKYVHRRPRQSQQVAIQKTGNASKSLSSGIVRAVQAASCSQTTSPPSLMKSLPAFAARSSPSLSSVPTIHSVATPTCGPTPK